MKSNTLPLANRTERFFAYLLDMLLLLSVKLFLMQLLGEGGAFMLSAFALEAVYFTLFISSTWCATPGQRMLGLATLYTNGRGLSQRAALERFLAYYLPLLPVYTSLLPPPLGAALATGLIIFWFAPILFTEERAGIHDQLCHTRVFTRKKQT